MNLRKTTFIILFLMLSAVLCAGQTEPKRKDLPRFVKASPAFAEILLQRTEFEADLEDLLVAYTLEFPKVKEIRYRLDMLNAEIYKLADVKQEESSKLTLALGKLMIRKADLETDLWNLQKQYSDEHPDVKKIKRKILVFDSAIKDILL
ncbi:MAG: hypothetical protein R2747_17755 [Pyrinomonadaceae bacterium]